MMLTPPFIKDSKSSLGMVNQEIDELRVAFVGRVTAFYPDKQTVDLDPVVAEPTYTADGTIDNIPWPPLSNVPVCTFGFGEWYLTMPIEVGSTVLVVCTDLELAQWYKRDQETNNSNIEYHTLNNAIAIAGINSSLKSLENYFTDGPEIRDRKGDTSIQVSDGKIEVDLKDKTNIKITDAKVEVDIGGKTSMEMSESEVKIKVGGTDIATITSSGIDIATVDITIQGTKIYQWLITHTHNYVLPLSPSPTQPGISEPAGPMPGG